MESSWVIITADYKKPFNFCFEKDDSVAPFTAQAKAFINDAQPPSAPNIHLFPQDSTHTIPSAYLRVQSYVSHAIACSCTKTGCAVIIMLLPA